MNLVLRQLSQRLNGTAKFKLLAPDAAISLETLEEETKGALVYTAFWNDAISTLLFKRTKIAFHVPGYDPHNFGLALDLDLPATQTNMQVTYDDLLHLMKQRGWYCYRRDGAVGQTGSGHFNFISENNPDEYMKLATNNPVSWDAPIEQKIYEKHIVDFTLSTAQTQSALKKLGLYCGLEDGEHSIYLHEAVLAFQRAFGIRESGNMDTAFQRVLAFVSAEIVLDKG